MPVVKSQPPNAGDLRDTSSIPGLGRSPGEGHGKPLQYSCLEILWTEETGWLWSVGLQRVGYAWSNLACTHTHTHNDQKSVSSREVIWRSHLEYRILQLLYLLWMDATLSLRLLPLPSASLTLNSLLVIDTLGISTTLESPVLLPCFTHTFILYDIRFTSLASDNTNTSHHLVSWGLSCQHHSLDHSCHHSLPNIRLTDFVRESHKIIFSCPTSLDITYFYWAYSSLTDSQSIVLCKKCLWNLFYI